MTITFMDSGVLITASRGVEDLSIAESPLKAI
jgi:hypothetical protein